jgi:hypothetical protein
MIYSLSEKYHGVVPISGFDGTSFEGILSKGQNLKEKCGIFSPLEFSRCTFEVSWNCSMNFLWW